MSLSPVDLAFAILLALAALRGYSKGLLGTAAGYVAPVVAFLMAADWSDPVRERIAEAMPAPDFVLDLAAPFVVFVVVVASIRLGASVTSRLLGVGQSGPSRAAAAAISALVTGAVLGSAVLLVHEMRPVEDTRADEASEILASPLEGLMVNLDDRFAASMLAQPLADLASLVVTEAARHKDDFHLPPVEKIQELTREAAGAAVRQVPVEDAARAVQDAATKAMADNLRAVDEATKRNRDAAAKRAAGSTK